MTEPGISVFTTFGDLLKYLRKRAQLTQRELAIAVGYSEAHVSRLEKNQRLPDLATTAALVIPALGLDDEPETAARLMQLAAGAHEIQSPANQSLTLAHARETIEISEISESIPSNLPLQLTSFIGRRAEMDVITQLLSGENSARLITLVGPGGIGKTRLALQTSINLLHLYQDGIWFVDLTPISSPELIPQVIASIFGVTETLGQSIEESIVRYLHSKHALIVVDNCEHLIHAAAQLVEKILRSCVHIHILATSREPLTIPGEVIFRIHPLSLPENVEGQNVIGHEAVQLFIERARNIVPSFVVTDSILPVIARICRRLDGMPLAIELAAAGTDFLSIGQIEARLDDRFHLLTRGQRTVPRHQTLRATIEWSYDLLEEAERVLFRRLSVFTGGWTLEAANAVCAEKGHDVLDLLAHLVHKSLVLAETQMDAGARYTMLETIREYAREELRAAGEMERMRAQHFEYFFMMVQQGESKLFALESSIDLAETEIDNLRAALAWTLEGDHMSGAPPEKRAGRGLELMTHIWPLWLSRGYISEGSKWMKQLLEAHTAPTPARARALLLAGDLARYRGDFNEQVTFIQESLVLAQKLGDKKRIAWALMEMGLVERDFRHYLEAIPFLMESLEMFQELNENLWVCRVSFLLAETYIANTGPESAKPLWKEGLRLSRQENDKWQTSWGLEGLGNVARLEGHLEQARELYTESLNLKVDIMDKAGITYVLEAFAQLAAAQNQFKHAAVLWGAAAQMRQSLNLLLIPSREEVYTSLIPEVRTQLGEEAFAAAWAEGKAMKMHEAVKYALKRSSD